LSTTQTKQAEKDDRQPVSDTGAGTERARLQNRTRHDRTIRITLFSLITSNLIACKSLHHHQHSLSLKHGLFSLEQNVSCGA
jgi:hypothetical protein